MITPATDLQKHQQQRFMVFTIPELLAGFGLSGTGFLNQKALPT